jgi:electron transport complex protein RnfC
MKLSPYLMDLYIRNNRYEDAEKLGVMNCIECGACTFVCPAKRMLTQSFRQGKRVIQTRRKAAADLEKQRQEEMAKEKAAKEEAKANAEKEG